MGGVLSSLIMNKKKDMTNLNKEIKEKFNKKWSSGEWMFIGQGTPEQLAEQDRFIDNLRKFILSEVVPMVRKEEREKITELTPDEQMRAGYARKMSGLYIQRHSFTKNE
jgi:hypothetical protein